MTTIALENVLTKAGLNVKPSEFLALVEDAARRLKPPNPEPAHYLSPEQRAALEDVGLDLSPQSEDERDYRARTVAAHTVLAESALTVGEAAALLGVDDSRIRHRLKERRLTGWKAQGGWRLPNWQFTPSGVLPGLDVVLRAAEGSTRARGRLLHDHPSARPGDQRQARHAQTVAARRWRSRARGPVGSHARHAHLSPHIGSVSHDLWQDCLGHRLGPYW